MRIHLITRGFLSEGLCREIEEPRTPEPKSLAQTLRLPQINRSFFSKGFVQKTVSTESEKLSNSKEPM